LQVTSHITSDAGRYIPAFFIMTSGTTVIILAIFLALLVAIALTRWIFKINTIVKTLEEIRDEMKTANMHESMKRLKAR